MMRNVHTTWLENFPSIHFCIIHCIYMTNSKAIRFYWPINAVAQDCKQMQRFKPSWSLPAHAILSGAPAGLSAVCTVSSSYLLLSATQQYTECSVAKGQKVQGLLYKNISTTVGEWQSAVCRRTKEMWECGVITVRLCFFPVLDTAVWPGTDIRARKFNKSWVRSTDTIPPPAYFCAFKRPQTLAANFPCSASISDEHISSQSFAHLD